MARSPVPEKLTILVSGREDDVSLSSVVHVLKEALAMLRDIDLGIAGTGKTTLRWDVVEASLHSPLTLTIAARAIDDTPSAGVASALVVGLSVLEREARTPEHFTDTTVQHAKKLVKALDDSVDSISIFAPGLPVAKPTQRVAANVDDIMKDEYQTVDSDLMGVLEILNAHGRVEFTIFDPITGQKTACKFDEEYLDAAAAAIRRRVLVSGLVKFNRQGRPVSMKVKGPIEVLDTQEGFEFLEGEGIDLTRGEDSGDFVRRRRDAD
jgi:hypothetical protein